MTVDYMSKIRTAIELAVRLRTNSEHTARSARKDVPTLACLLTTTSLRRTQGRMATFHAKDILQEGNNQMPDAVEALDRSLQRVSGIAQRIEAEPSGTTDQQEDEASIHSNAAAVDDIYGGTDDLPDDAPSADLSAAAQEINEANNFNFDC